MKYRAKCTHCASPIMNIYPRRNNYYVTDANDLYIEVSTEEEANLIEQLNGHQESSFRIYNELVKITSNNHQS